MKLKTQLSISSFILSSLLLLLALGIASHIHSSYRKKSAIERFQNSVSSFDEFKNSQIRVLSQSAEIISLEPAWVGLKSTHEQDWISRLLEQCQKKSGASQILLIQNGRITHSHPSINHASSSADLLKNRSGSLNRDDSAKKIGGLIAFQGKLHVFAMASVGQETSNSFLVF
mgnify:CR=1 FL=1